MNNWAEGVHPFVPTVSKYLLGVPDSVVEVFKSKLTHSTTNVKAAEKLLASLDTMRAGGEVYEVDVLAVGFALVVFDMAMSVGNLRDAANDVINSWEQGDLAGAVRDLHDAEAEAGATMDRVYGNA